MKFNICWLFKTGLKNVFNCQIPLKVEGLSFSFLTKNKIDEIKTNMCFSSRKF